MYLREVTLRNYSTSLSLSFSLSLSLPLFDKKGAYCFALLISLSVGQSVDPAISAQYLLTPLLESCQTWYSGCPKRVDVPCRFSGHVVKDQGQTVGLCSDGHSISLDSYAGKLPNFIQWILLASK